MLQVRTNSAEETRALAAAIAPILRAGDVLILSGDLGGGKTAFTQGLAAAIGIDEPVTSPTFVLAQTYEGRLRLHHLDVYRLDSAAEVRDLAVDELAADEAVTVIEWGERFLEHFPRSYLRVTFGLGAIELSPDVRLIDLQPVGAAWESRRSLLQQATAPWKRN